MVDLIRYVQRMRTEKLNLLTEQLNDLQSQVNSTPIGYDKTKAVRNRRSFEGLNVRRMFTCTLIESIKSLSLLETIAIFR